MNDFLLMASIVFGIIVLIGFFNEKVTHMTYEIALLLFSVIIGIIITLIWTLSNDIPVRDFLDRVQFFDLERLLMKGVLCFMLFAGSKNLKVVDFRKNARSVSVLAFLCTLLGAVFYGLLFWLVSGLMNLSFSLPMCLMVGSIVAPTDPIAATAILKKFGLSKKIGFLMEAESLLNDGVGVALFVCFSGMVATGEGGGFVLLMGREIFGAVLIGGVIGAICYLIFFYTENVHLRVFITLLSVAASFYLCELFDCSGAIACVVCGLIFSTVREKLEKRSPDVDLKDLDSYWETTDVLLNSVLYVILGLSYVRIIQMPTVGILSTIAVLLNLISRFGSVFIGSFLIGPLPDGYSQGRFTALFTWGGLKGGLCIALAMSTANIVSTDQYHIILGCIYATVFFTTVIQGLTMKKVHSALSR